MKRRNFIKSLSTLGLASVAMTPTLASIPGGNNKDSIRARIPISTDWDVIVVGGGPSGCAAAAAAARRDTHRGGHSSDTAHRPCPALL